jgi:hypothetical protein
MKDNPIDEKISVRAESIARLMERRKFISTAAKGVVAVAAAVALGSFTGIKKAFADSCTCDWALGNHCFGERVEFTCPSGCSTCTSINGQPSCNGWCNWASGYWVSCSGLGVCGHGWRLCLDCECNNDCGNLCTLLTGIFCNGCCTSMQVEEEMRRLHLLTQSAR